MVIETDIKVHLPLTTILHSSKCIGYVLLRLILRKVLNTCFASSILKDISETTCFQQKSLVLDQHGDGLSVGLLLDLISSLFCSIVLGPIFCLRFLILRKAQTISGDAWNPSINSELTCKIASVQSI